MSQTLLPVFALFTRALRADLRAKFPSILRSVALVVLLVLLWSNQRMYVILQNAAGGLLLSTIATLNFAGITILGFATFCSAITEEKEDGTLALLRMTRLNPLAILLGKSTARLTGGLLFLAVQIPFTMLCVTLGGVTVLQVLNVYLVLGGWLFFLCNLGLLFSVVYRGTTRAVVTTILVCFFLFVLAPFLWNVRYNRRSAGLAFVANSPFGPLTEYLTSINPAADVSGIFRGKGVVLVANSLPFLLVAGAVCFGVSWMLFEHFCGGELAETLPKRRVSAKGRSGRSKRVWRWPLAWKDFHFETGGRRGVWIRLALYGAAFGSAVGFGGDHFSTARWWEDLGMLAQVCGGLGFVLEIALGAANVFGKERKQHTLGTLWTLPTPAGRWIWQKVGGHAPLLLLPGLLWCVGWWLDDDVSRISANRLGTAELELFAMRRVYSAVQVFLFAAFVACLFLRWWRGTLVGGALAAYLWYFSAPHYDASLRYVEALRIQFAVQLLFFPVLITYLSLRLRNGALVWGLLALFLWNAFPISLLSALRWGSRWSYRSNVEIAYVWCLSILLIVAGVALALRIPARLAACAAED